MHPRPWVFSRLMTQGPQKGTRVHAGAKQGCIQETGAPSCCRGASSSRLLTTSNRSHPAHYWVLPFSLQNSVQSFPRLWLLENDPPRLQPAPPVQPHLHIPRQRVSVRTCTRSPCRSERRKAIPQCRQEPESEAGKTEGPLPRQQADRWRRPPALRADCKADGPPARAGQVG